MRRIAHGLTFPALAKKSTHGCLRFVQHDKTKSVVPNASEESKKPCFSLSFGLTSDGKLCIAEIERVMQRLIFL